jgi:hypothetical protein
MGYSFTSLSRILKDEDLFKDKSILTLGTLFPYLKSSEFDTLEKSHPNKDIKSLRRIPKENFSEYLFDILLGAKCIHSIDVSDYQGSQIVWNLNDPIPSSLANSYDVIIDSGTLEHISNFSCALKNLFAILVSNGIYYFGLPCNNWINHGFFQFSPTLFIDLCIDNTSLKLLRLELDVFDGSTSYSSHSYSILDEQSYILNSIYRSSNRLNVSGIIQKKETAFQLSLVQSKYRHQYDVVVTHSSAVISTNAAAITKSRLVNRLKSTFNNLISRYFNLISTTPLLSLPFKIKLFRVTAQLIAFLKHLFLLASNIFNHRSVL